MSQIKNGKVILSETGKNAMGGTEIIRQRVINNIDKNLLKGVCIHFSRIYDLDPRYKNILYIHDLPDDPRYDELHNSDVVNAFDRFVFVSYHQRDIFLMKFNLPYSKCRVIANAIGDYFNDVSQKKDRDVKKLIYHTTPHRGLSLLLPIFKELKKYHNVTLDVYSSYKIYDNPNADQNFSQLFKELEDTDGVVMHGSVDNSEIIDALIDSDMFIYPCIWHETSCMALMEAIQNGCICVHPDYGALVETSNNMSYYFPMDENIERLANKTYNLSKYILDNYSLFKNDLNMKSNRFMPYSLEQFKNHWHSTLKELKDE